MRWSIVWSFAAGAATAAVLLLLVASRTERNREARADEYIQEVIAHITKGADQYLKPPGIEWMDYGGTRGPRLGVEICQGSDTSLLLFSRDNQIVGACVLRQRSEPTIEWIRYDAEGMQPISVSGN